MKVIVIGGVAAGMSAASKIKRTDKTARVVVYEKGGFLSYGACGLPYYVGGYNDDYRRMIARTREQFEAAGIETHLHHEVLAVDPTAKTVRVKNLETGETFAEGYDKLMVATGSRAVMPPLPGIDMLGIHSLKTLEDGIFLKEFAGQASVQNVVIVGGGYIGIECAEAFAALGKSVRLIEAGPRILPPFDEELAALATAELAANGVGIHTGEVVKGFEGGSAVQAVVTDKDVYPADLVLVAVGVRPATEFLAGSGIEMDEKGAVLVDSAMRTNKPDVFAAGDCILCYDRVQGADSYLALGTVANKCGRIAGSAICGEYARFDGALGSAAIKVFDIEMFRTGLDKALAKKAGRRVRSATVTSYDHPGYYPGQTPLLVKVFYEEGTKVLLGAQLCGQKGAVLRGDVFAVAIHAGLTTAQLGTLDLAYAPPFAGVWDAVQIACNAAK